MRTAYDPWNRDEERELEQLAEAREAHQAWSLEQSLKGNDATRRESVGVWVKPALPPELQPEARS